MPRRSAICSLGRSASIFIRMPRIKFSGRTASSAKFEIRDHAWKSMAISTLTQPNRDPTRQVCAFWWSRDYLGTHERVLPPLMVTSFCKAHGRLLLALLCRRRARFLARYALVGCRAGHAARCLLSGGTVVLMHYTRSRAIETQSRLSM